RRGDPRAPGAMKEEGRGRVRHAPRQLLFEEPLRERARIAGPHDLELDALVEEVREHDRSVRQRPPRRADEVLAADLERRRTLGEAIRLPELELVHGDAEDLGVSLGGGPAVDLERARAR